MSNLIFSINAVAPVFLIILLGIFLKKINIMDDDFVSKSSTLVFKLALPSLVFQKVSSINFKESFNLLEMILLVAGTFFALGLAWIFSRLFIKENFQKGSFIQGSFRGNVAVLGLALILNVFGENIMARSAVMVVVLIPLFNILAVLVLTLPMQNGKKTPWTAILFNLLKNPLIIAILLALPFSLLNIEIWPLAITTLSYLSRIALPLALLGIGGSLNFKTIREHLLLSIAAAAIKIVIMPLTVTVSAWYMGVRGVSLGIIFIVASSPTAISSFVMARAMDNDSHLAANIIMVTTFGSVFTTGAGIFIMKYLGMF